MEGSGGFCWFCLSRFNQQLFEKTDSLFEGIKRSVMTDEWRGVRQILGNSRTLTRVILEHKIASRNSYP